MPAETFDRLILAADPGAKGCLSFILLRLAGPLSDPPNQVHVRPLVPGALEINALLSEICNGAPFTRIAYLEQVSGFAGTARTGASMFSFGRSFGNLESSILAWNFELHRVPPAKWQKVLGALTRKGESRPDHKRRLVTLARELWPALIGKSKVSLVSADSLLLLHYALKTENQSTAKC